MKHASTEDGSSIVEVLGITVTPSQAPGVYLLSIDLKDMETGTTETEVYPVSAVALWELRNQLVRTFIWPVRDEAFTTWS